MLDEYVVNDALALTQYLTQHLSEEQATAYLASISGISLESWKEAKCYLPTVDKTKRQTKEANIKDIVYVFVNTEITTNFALKTLSLIPGFQAEFIEFTTYIADSIRTVKAAVSSRLTTLPSFKANSSPNDVQQYRAPQEENFPPMQTPAPPHAPLTTYANSSASINFQQRSAAAPPNGQWQKVNNKRQQPLKKDNTWLQGTGSAQDAQIAHQLKFLCLGVRSGPNETVDTLKIELKQKWKIPDLKVEAVSKSGHSTMFRIQMNIQASKYEKWKDSSMWPARMEASLWRGNPRSILKPLNERIYSKKIYIGNLSKDITTEQVKNNLKTIYEAELQETGPIADIEVYLNQRGWERSNTAASKDPNKELRQSMCIVLISKTGRSLSQVDLKTDHYPHYLQRTVRYWKGPIPYPEGHSKIMPKVSLTWE